MSDFERTYQIDPSRESHSHREKYPSIELSDKEHLQKRESGRKRNITVEIINHLHEIPIKLKIPKVEKSIAEGKKNEKSKSKSTTRKPKKVNPKPNKSTVESLQAQL